MAAAGVEEGDLDLLHVEPMLANLAPTRVTNPLKNMKVA